MANITLKQFLLHNVDGRSSKKIEDLYNVLDDVKTLLTNIKDVDGIKKILDTVAVSETELQSRVGDTNDAASAAGAVGSLAAKLRRLTIDLDDVQGKIGASSDALVDAGAVGSVSAKLRRLTTDLGVAQTKLNDLMEWVDGTDTTSAPKMTLSGNLVQIWGNEVGDRPDYTSITVPTSFTILNTNLDTWVTDGTNDWVEV